MACLDEFKTNKINEAMEFLAKRNLGKTVSFDYKKGVVTITPNSSSQVSSVPNAIKYAGRMLDQLNSEFGETYRFDVYGNWGTIYPQNSKVEIKLNFPKSLEAALEKRETQKAYNEAYSEFLLDERMMMDEANEEYYDDLPQQSLDKLDFSVLVDYKKLMLKRTDAILQSLNSLYTHNKTAETKAKINEVRRIKDGIESDLGRLLNPATIFEDTLAFITNDLETIDTLLESSSITNLQTAEKMISFYERISDYSLENKGNNPFLTLEGAYNEKGDLLLEDEITEVLDNLNRAIRDKKSKLLASKQDYLQQLVENSDHLKRLYPEMTLDEILKEIEDIGAVSKNFLTIDKVYKGSDSLLGQLIRLELEKNRHTNKSYIKELTSKINALAPRVEKFLPKIGGILNRLASESDWSIFYQQNSEGRKTGRIVDKFSVDWFKSYRNAMADFNMRMDVAIRARDGEQINSALTTKYKWLNNNTNFINIASIPEIISNPEFEKYASYFTQNPEYVESVKQELGEAYYNKIVAKQVEQLREYKEWEYDLVTSSMIDEGVITPDQLSESAKFRLNVTMLKNNPFEFNKAHQSGKGNMVPFNLNTSYPSNIKYIEYYPKENVQRFNSKSNSVESTPSGFYDPNFKNIESNPEMFQFWETLEESVNYMNMTLADAESMLKHGSILSMKKSFTDILIDPNSSLGAKGLALSPLAGGLIGAVVGGLPGAAAGFMATKVLTQKEWLSKQFTSKATTDKNANDFTDINKSQFQTNEAEIYQRTKLEKLKFERLTNISLANPNVERHLINQDGVNFLLNLSGYTTEEQLFGKGGKIDIDKLIKDVVTDQVMNEQTFNLPVLLRAYLEMTAEYKAQKESLPQITIYKEFYESIKRPSTNPNVDTSNRLQRAFNYSSNSTGLSQERINARERLNDWFNRNVLGNRDSSPWVDLGKRDTWLFSSFNKIEKELKKEYEAIIKDPNTDEETKAQAVSDLGKLGSNFVLSAIYDSVINDFAIYKGLAFNIKAQIANRFQGWFQALAYDNGSFATEGNMQTAMGFTTRRGARFLGMKNYSRQIDIAKLLINQLAVLQDATNEVDRARNTSGITGIAKKFQPFYATEYTEWNNQAPQILAILMDQKITDLEGNEVPVFTGRHFPAYNIQNGKLVLRPEFDTPENRQEWLEFETPTAADTKNYISSVLSLINGDYSKTGTIYAKKTSVGKTLMLFKTWMPNAIWNRFGGVLDPKGQANLQLGKADFKGTYASQRASTLALYGLLPGALAFGLPAAIGLGITGAVVGGINQRIQGNSMKFDLRLAKEMATVGQAVVKKMIGIPVNFVSGKDLVKNHQMGNMSTSPEDLQRLKSIMAELAVLLSLVLFKVIVKGLLGPNDDEEPKTIMVGGKKQPNPYYGMNLQTDREKQMHNMLENELTRTINDLTLYSNPAAIYDNITRTSIAMTLDDAIRIADATIKYQEGLDRLQTGPNAGESRLANSLQRSFMPGVFQDPETLGFGKSMETEFVKGEYIDSYFFSDYKEDRKLAKADKSISKEKYTMELQERIGYDALTPEQRLIMDDKIEKKVNAKLKSENKVNRRAYDKEQNKRELKK